MYAVVGKRVLDVLLAGVALVGLSPLLAAVAIAIWLEGGRPVLIRQQRVGRDGESFTMLKFRSMPPGTTQAVSVDAGGFPITRVGRVIRRTNVDELPQLWNIALGHMSVVGPRPALASQHELLALRSASGAARLRPGLTGLAQVNAYDGMPTAEKARFDAEYADGLSLRLDLTILGRTFGYLRRPPPVY